MTFGVNTGSGGLRFYDANHTVSYNYVQNVVGGPFQGPLQLDTGDVEGTSTTLDAHWRIVNALVERNVIVQGPEGIRVGDNFDLAPTGCTVQDNLVAQTTTGTAVTQVVAPVNSTLTNNTYYATPGTAGLTLDAAGIYRRDGYGPRLTYLQAADVGVNGDVSDADGTGLVLTGGTPPVVTTPTFVGMGTPVTGSSTSITVPAPAGVQSGDFHLVVITSTASETITGVPANWLLLGTQPMTSPTSPDRGGDAVAVAYYSLSATSSVTFTKSGSGFFHAVRGLWRGVGGVEQAAVTVAPAGSALSTPAVSSASADAVVVGVVAADLPLVSAGPYTPPSGWTERYDTTQTSGNDNLSIAIAEVPASTAPEPTPSDSAATSFSWGTPLATSDEFAYTGAPSSTKWELMTGAGAGGYGTRSASRVTVNGSSMVITGLAGTATTGAALHNVWQRYGRWEARVRSTTTGSTGTSNYRVNLLLAPADGVVTPSTTMQDVDTSDTPEVAWPHTAGIPGERLVVSFTMSGLSARYRSLVQQAVDIWSRSSVFAPAAVETCPGGFCCTMRTMPIGSDPDTDGETDSDDSGGVRHSSTITLYTDWLDNMSDNGALVTTAHEMGHVFGLVHRNNAADMMNATTDDNTYVIPDLVDFSNITAFYGAGASGEYAFLEAAQAGQTGSTITLHYPRLSGSDATESITVPGLDLSQWHNYAIEWTSTQIVVWVDGVERFRKSGGGTSTRRDLQNNRGPMRLGVRLDATAASGMRAAQMEVDWARAYALP